MGIVFEGVDTNDVNAKIWSLYTSSFGEVNAYRLALEQVVDLIDVAIEEDKFEVYELIIAPALQQKVAIGNDNRYEEQSA